MFHTHLIEVFNVNMLFIKMKGSIKHNILDSAFNVNMLFIKNTERNTTGERL